MGQLGTAAPARQRARRRSGQQLPAPHHGIAPAWHAAGRAATRVPLEGGPSRWTAGGFGRQAQRPREQDAGRCEQRVVQDVAGAPAGAQQCSVQPASPFFERAAGRRHVVVSAHWPAALARRPCWRRCAAPARRCVHAHGAALARARTAPPRTTTGSHCTGCPRPPASARRRRAPSPARYITLASGCWKTSLPRSGSCAAYRRTSTRWVLGQAGRRVNSRPGERRAGIRPGEEGGARHA